MATPPSSTAPPSAASQFTYSNPSSSSYFPMPFHLQQPQYPAPYAAAVPPAPAYSLPQQYQQAQQLFQRDAQTITPEALESVKAALANSEIEHKAEAKKKAIPRKAAGQAWEDPTLAEWPENVLAFADDYRLFCGDLGKYVGNRPIKLRKSNWRERIDYDALEKQKNFSHKKPKLSKKSVLHK
ncbi:hypothetical protein ACLB2K_061535 [Fragaria x ananassa]